MLIRSKHKDISVQKGLAKGPTVFHFEPVEEMEGWFSGTVPDEVAAYLFSVSNTDYVKVPEEGEPIPEPKKEAELTEEQKAAAAEAADQQSGRKGGRAGRTQ